MLRLFFHIVNNIFFHKDEFFVQKILIFFIIKLEILHAFTTSFGKVDKI